MKNLLKFLGIITIAVIIGISLSACNNDGGNTDEGLPSAGNGSLGLTFEKVYDVTGAEGITISNIWLSISKYYYDEECEEYSSKNINFPINEDQEWDYSNWLNQGFTHPIPGSQVKLENGKLTLKLGTPTEDFMDHFADDYSLDHFTYSQFSADYSKLSATDGLKTISFSQLEDWDNWGDLRWGKPYPIIMLVYANKDGNVSGSVTQKYDDGTLNIKYNWNLKKGWNTVIAKQEKNVPVLTLITGTPDASIKWVYED